eukprot:TRINITY_DN66383_c0_g1_i1.p1 TRINITY_DN66383_c0_g1~~TRINITY_DN66383_c0_g1_i1.p1  ORF type:complete len:620 (+),score=128.04 TRINITY_DN66383_c0_g1_i1:73-1860(+)
MAADDLKRFRSRADHSWLDELVADPETEKHQPNKKSRQATSGHYVLVRPTPLPKPSLIAFSPPMAAELGLTEAACQSEEFTRFFSGDIGAIEGFKSWATPYALSIYGQEMYDNCPFKNGNGYGDGRAVSIGEVVFEGKRWEMQLKGGGTTPFCRGADGRAVLRSSIREYLASEAMHAMGVETTRALSLVVSGQETTDRPWYDTSKKRPKADEALLIQCAPHLASAPEELKERAIAQLRSQLRDPDKMQTEPCAITCRVAPSFTRVGHIDLHGRRARKGGKEKLEHLELMVKHALRREYADVDDPTASLESRVLRMVKEFANRLQKMVSDWLRVGYCQGNFNSDNCLVAGRTMDYGPFGFMEKYDPKWNMWVGGGEHFSFMNQPKAAHKNFLTFVKAIVPLLSDGAAAEAQAVVNSFEQTCAKVCGDMWRRKLGLSVWDGEAEGLWDTLKELMKKSSVDYTIFWRQLAELPGKGLTSGSSEDQLLQPLKQAFYSDLPSCLKEEWIQWLKQWLKKIEADGRPQEAAKLMRQTSPKYVPREWMLVEAYQAASKKDYSLIHSLYKLFSKPFDEQPEFEERYYRKAPSTADELPGTAFMS